MSYAEMSLPPRPLRELPVSRVRLSPPDMVLHARVGQTVLWLKHRIEGRACDRRELSALMLRFRQLFVPFTAPTLQEHFAGAAYALAHPSEHGLEESLTAAHVTVLEYVDAMFTQGFGEGTQAAFDAAVLAGDVDAAKRCVAATVDFCDLNGTTALMVAAREGHAEMVSWLLAIGASPTAQDVFGETYLAHGHSFKIEV